MQQTINIVPYRRFSPICNENLIIFIDQHLTELIIGGLGGLLSSTIYDGIKLSIKALWRKLVSYYLEQKIKYQEDKNYIELSFKIKPDLTLEFYLNGDINEKIINNLSDNISSIYKIETNKIKILTILSS